MIHLLKLFNDTEENKLNDQKMNHSPMYASVKNENKLPTTDNSQRHATTWQGQGQEDSELRNDTFHHV